jgi:hypothetical protein
MPKTYVPFEGNLIEDPQFNIKTFLELTEENQKKVECIYVIAVLIKESKAPKLTVIDFDYLYDKPLDELDHLTNYIRSRTNAYHNIEGE